MSGGPLVGTVEVGERTEVRVRDSGAGVQTDAEAGFRFRLALHGRRFEFGLATAPRIAAFSWADSQRAVLASTPGQLTLGYRERHFGIFLSQDGSYGLENYATLRYPTLATLPGTPPGTPTTPSTLPTLPPAQSVAYASSRTAFSAYQSPTPRWLVTEYAAFEASGGTTETSRNFVPFQYGPHLGLTLDRRVTRTDRLGGSVDAAYARFSTGADVGIANGLVRWAHDLARATTITVGAGPSGAAFRVQPEGYRTRLYPAAEVDFAHHRGFLGHPLDVDAVLRVGPVIDRIAATVDPRFTAGLAANYTTRPVSVRLGVSFAQSLLPSSAQVTAFSTEAIVRVPLTRAVALEGGTRIALQSFQGTFFGTYGVFLALDLHPSMLHFRTP